MSQQENVAALNRAAQAINEGNFDVLRQGYTANVKEHDPAPGQKPGPEGYVDFFRAVRTAFPDFKLSAEHMVADADQVALAYTMTGTHKGMFQGIPATGKKIQARGVLIARFENGKIAERWGSSDELGILKQLGAVITPASEVRKAA
jgi:steroid delta-isomerase-like uncharacterized protein